MEKDLCVGNVCKQQSKTELYSNASRIYVNIPHVHMVKKENLDCLHATCWSICYIPDPSSTTASLSGLWSIQQDRDVVRVWCTGFEHQPWTTFKAIDKLLIQKYWNNITFYMTLILQCLSQLTVFNPGSNPTSNCMLDCTSCKWWVVSILY